MAGSGHKQWAAGDVVGASGDTDINTALLEQVVGVYAASANRDAAFGGAGEPTLAEGMFCYLNDTNEFQVYNGSAWVTIGDPDVLVVDSANARVGIVTDTPLNPLHIRAAATVLQQIEATDSNQAYCAFGNSTTGVGLNNGLLVGVDTDETAILWNQEATTLRFATSGTLRMSMHATSGLVNVVGEFTAGTKTFDIAHPTKGGDWRLRHASVEGPKNDLIYRGTVTLAGGTATVDLDEASNMTAGTWAALCTNPWSMVASSGNPVEWVLDGSTLTISGPAGAVCNWMVMAERHDNQVKGDQAPSSDSDGRLIVEYEREAEPSGLADA